MCKPVITVLTGFLPGFVPIPSTFSYRFLGDLIAPGSGQTGLLAMAGPAAAIIVFIALIYLALAGILLARVWCQVLRHGQLVDDSLQKGYMLKPSSLRRLDPDISVPPEVRIVATPEDEGPVTIGILHPAIVLPETMLPWVNGHRDPTAEERRRFCQVLRHELAHVANRDYAMSLLANILLSLFWFHPIAHWAYRRLRLNNELCCDLDVVRSGVAPVEYVDTLMNVVAGKFSTPGFALSMLGDHRPAKVLGCRVDNVLAGWRKFEGKKQAWAYAVLIVVLAASPRFLAAPPPPMMEVLFADGRVELCTLDKADYLVANEPNVLSVYLPGTLRTERIDGLAYAVADAEGRPLGLPADTNVKVTLADAAEPRQAELLKEEQPTPPALDDITDGTMVANASDKIDPDETKEAETTKSKSSRRDWVTVDQVFDPSVPDSPFRPPFNEHR